MTLVCNRLIYLWNKGVKPEEKHLDAFETAIKTKDLLKNNESLSQSLKDIRKKYNLQKSIIKQGLEKIGLD